MGKLLDDFAALHNFKQRNGLNPEKGNVTKAYIMERKLHRQLMFIIKLKGEAAVCKASGLTAFQLDEVLDCLIPMLNTDQLTHQLDFLERGKVKKDKSPQAAKCFLKIWEQFYG